MKAIAILIVMVYLVQPVKVVPVELRKYADYINYDQQHRMFYIDSAGARLYYNDVTSFHVMGRWQMDVDLKVSSAALFIGI
jgi:hypothetical protein